MMGSALSTVYLGLTYCCCSATGSLCNSCLGTTAAGTNGRKRSVLLLAMSITLALWFQYYVARSIILEDIPRHSWHGKDGVFKAWKDPACEAYEDTSLQVQCAGNAGAFRPTSLAALFFLGSAIGTKMVPSVMKEAWLAKYTVFLFGIFFTMFIPNAPVFLGIFLWIARFGATIFVVMQQVILIDMAYNWNEDWVEKSNECDRPSYGSGQKWLRAIVTTCVSLYGLAIVGISLLFRVFRGCPENNAVLN